MSKKHFIYGAELIVQNHGKNTFSYKINPVYKNLLKLFMEFGKEFDPKKFDLYIEKKLICQ